MIEIGSLLLILAISPGGFLELNETKIKIDTNIATVIDESCKVSTFRSINDGIEIDAEQVRTANTRSFVLSFSEIRNDRSHHLTNIFNNHFISGNWFHGEQSPVVDTRLGEFELLFTELKLKGNNN